VFCALDGSIKLRRNWKEGHTGEGLPVTVEEGSLFFWKPLGLKPKL